MLIIKKGIYKVIDKVMDYLFVPLIYKKIFASIKVTVSPRKLEL